jgi:hypothetical protein
VSYEKLLVILVAVIFILFTMYRVRPFFSFCAVLAVITFMLGGCAATNAGHPVDGGFLFTVSGAFVGISLASIMFSYGLFSDYWKPALLFLVIAGLLALGGCAALPMPLQPETQNNSNYAEGAVIVLTAVDTAQTMHIRKGTSCDHEANPLMAKLYGSKYPAPGRVLATNLALLTVHTMVASWLDDKVDQHKTDDSAGLWYVGRITFHAVGILGEGAAVADNASRGCAL